MILFEGCFSVRVFTCLFIFTLCGRIHGALNERVVVVKEDSDAILPCSLSTKENIESKLFDWRKDGQKDVFLYDAGIHYNNGHPGQDEQFKGRVSHFSDQLKNGNASIKIQNTKVADSGNYTCVFPRLQPRQIFHIKLVVDGILRDRRVINFPGAASEPSVKILDQTNDGMKLQCEVLGVSPKPEVEWKDSSGNIVPAEVPEITEREGSYDIILKAAVTKTDRYRCVVTQKEIYHQVYTDVYLQFAEKPKIIFEGDPTGMIVGAAIFGFIFLVLVVFVLGWKPSHKRVAAPKPNITILDATDDKVLLQCEVQGAFPQPKVEWKDSAGNILPAEGPQISPIGGRYYITLLTTVTKSGLYHCVVTQKETGHQTEAEIFVYFKGRRRRENGSEKPSIRDPEEGMSL